MFRKKVAARPRVGQLVYTGRGLGVIELVAENGRLDCRRLTDGGHRMECRHPACHGLSSTCPICRLWATDADVLRPDDAEGLVARTVLEAARKAGK